VARRTITDVRPVHDEALRDFDYEWRLFKDIAIARATFCCCYMTGRAGHTFSTRQRAAMLELVMQAVEWS